MLLSALSSESRIIQRVSSSKPYSSDSLLHFVGIITSIYSQSDSSDSLFSFSGTACFFYLGGRPGFNFLGGLGGGLALLDFGNVVLFHRIRFDRLCFLWKFSFSSSSFSFLVSFLALGNTLFKSKSG